MQRSTFDSALDSLNEAAELSRYEAYEQAALSGLYAPSSDIPCPDGASGEERVLIKDAIEATGGDNVEILGDGAWVAIRVWVPSSAISCR